MAERVLTARELNRALLARQGLLERLRSPLPQVLKRMGTLQAQYAPSMYVGLWSRLGTFQRADLDGALERRSVVQATLMRGTIHLVAKADYWPLSLASRVARRRKYLRAYPATDPASMQDAASRLRDALADGPMHRRDVEALIGKEAARGVGEWLELVRVPPSGTWDRRRADVYGLADDWVGPPPDDSDPEVHLVRRYLGGYGPASRHDIASFTGWTLTEVDAVLARITTRAYATEDGVRLVDLPSMAMPGPDWPAPVRLIGHWDVMLLAHARRTSVLPEEHRPKIFHVRRPHSTAVFLVDGAVAGEWSLDGSYEAYAPLDPGALRELEAELERFRSFAA